MKGDFSRNTFNKRKHYSSVRLQQGRVQTDADWNEQADIFHYHLRTETNDFIGGDGAPISQPGYEISPTADGQNLLIGAGRYYVNGLLCEQDALSLYTEQNDYPAARLPSEDGVYLAYLDVWQQSMTALDDPTIQEVALQGSDTATRIKNTAQVKLLCVGDVALSVDRESIFPQWETLITPSTGQLTASVNDSANVGNHLYRVEVHDSGDKSTATFKWSRDNATLAANIIAMTDDIIRIDSQLSGREFAPGQWLELTSKAQRLAQQPGYFVRLASVNADQLHVGLWPEAISELESSVKAERLATLDRVCLWNTRSNNMNDASQYLDIEQLVRNSNGQVELTVTNQILLPDSIEVGQFVELTDPSIVDEGKQGDFSQIMAINDNVITLRDLSGIDNNQLTQFTQWRLLSEAISQVNSSDSIELENGLLIQCSEGMYQTGDYWLIPTRKIDNHLEWPIDEQTGLSQAKSPDGNAHTYVRLALLELQAQHWQLREDYRRVFSPIADFKAIDVLQAEANAPTASIYVDNNGKVTFTSDVDISGTLMTETEIITPKEISGLQLWFDGADKRSLVLDGANVKGWFDKSGNHFHAQQAAKHQQALYLKQEGTVHFDGNGRHLALPIDSLNNIDEMTWFFVAKQHKGTLLSRRGELTVGDNFTNALAWQYFDAPVELGNEQLKGFTGASFDGRYVYFSPHAYQGGGRHGNVLRFDTQADFSDSNAWQYFNPGAHGVGSIAESFCGTIFDGKYVYFVPYSTVGTYHAEVLRYDTSKDFSTANAWQAFNPATHGVSDDFLGGFLGAVFDGQYIYFVPYRVNDNTLHGNVLRYNTSKAFSDINAWQAFYPARRGIGKNPVGFGQGLFDGRYVYFVPHRDNAGWHGEALRYDSHAEFTDIDAWQTFDITTINPISKGFDGAVFDGRYVYFVPGWNGITSENGTIVRYDTRLEFTDSNAWQFFDPGKNGLGTQLTGFNGAVFDGRYVYFVPYGHGQPVRHGNVLRYDIQMAFADINAWQYFNAAGEISNTLIGFDHGVYDGRYVYLSPFINNHSYHGQFLRYDTQATPAMKLDRRGQFLQNGGSGRLLNAEQLSIASVISTNSEISGYSNSKLVNQQIADNHPLPVDQVTIIGSHYDGTFPFDGDIAEVIAYDRVLTDSEREQIEDYLSAKWSISLN